MALDRAIEILRVALELLEATTREAQAAADDANGALGLLRQAAGEGWQTDLTATYNIRRGRELVESALDQFTLGSEAINRIIPMLGK